MEELRCRIFHDKRILDKPVQPGDKCVSLNDNSVQFACHRDAHDRIGATTKYFKEMGL